jgi:flagellar biosynthesis/type III secretory pathway protein FliH
MKRIFGSLVVSGSVGVLVTTALVVAQEPKAIPPPPAAPEAKPAAPAKRAVANAAAVKKAREAARAAQLENLVQQFMRQGRPSVRAELILVRNICHLNMEELRAINRDAESALKEAVTKMAEAQQ